MTRFSIIMPLYNKTPYVRKAVASVMGQSPIVIAFGVGEMEVRDNAFGL